MRDVSAPISLFQYYADQEFVPAVPVIPCPTAFLPYRLAGHGKLPL
jgi:hypothetical protein